MIFPFPFKGKAGMGMVFALRAVSLSSPSAKTIPTQPSP